METMLIRVRKEDVKVFRSECKKIFLQSQKNRFNLNVSDAELFNSAVKFYLG